jgi:HD-GYP domain-containing protein (c-di-GMP phosphodiesterase class II)
VVDAYDAMTHDRPYRRAMSHEEAAQELIRCRGTQFDGQLVELYLQVIGDPARIKAGSSVLSPDLHVLEHGAERWT